VECLGELEKLARLQLVDLYYGDESRVSMEACVPYGWQFKDENVFMPSSKGAGLNCFALLSRANDCRFETTRQRITSTFIIEQLERLSFSIKQTTVVVLDNARVHTSKKVQERRRFWQERGLFIFYLPPYSPHLPRAASHLANSRLTSANLFISMWLNVALSRISCQMYKLS